MIPSPFICFSVKKSLSVIDIYFIVVCAVVDGYSSVEYPAPD
jgi:hypothetical protein